MQKHELRPQLSSVSRDQLNKLGRDFRIAEAIPLYEKVKRQLSETILMGTWPPGTVLPPESALAESLGVAVGTVRRALGELTAEGVLARRRRTGTVVTGRRPHHSLRMCFQYFRLHGPNDSLVRSKTEVASYHRRPAAQAEAKLLQLHSNATVHEISRVRSVSGRPIMHDRIILSTALAPLIESAEDLPELLYLHLLENYGVRIAALREKIGADLSNQIDAELLRLSKPTPILTIDEIAFDQKSSPVLLSFHRAITDKFKYINEVN
ncbi:MAG: GntR family transcriptional regulator [Proteobacteria bacterium]|nr:GntR family transcriptional regulator [Pseudomonadota bacterium]